MNRTFKLGLDIHGVIDRMPEFFSFLSESIINSGGEVHIITGSNIEKAKVELSSFNIKYTTIFSIQDHHKKLGTPTTEKHPKWGFPMISDELWDKTKSDYCAQNNIDLHIDDTINYGKLFTTPFCKLWINKKIN
jgi:hypothetical protein